MLDLYTHITTVDTFTFWVSGTLTVLAALTIRQMTEASLLSAIFTVPLYHGALVSIYVCRQMELIISTAQQPNTILCAALGITLTALVLLAATRLTYSAIEHAVRRGASKRGLDQPRVRA